MKISVESFNACSIAFYSFSQGNKIDDLKTEGFNACSIAFYSFRGANSPPTVLSTMGFNACSIAFYSFSVREAILEQFKTQFQCLFYCILLF